jgi:SAM-dependent methyltransferase
MFEQLEKINRRPTPYEFYTTQMLWDDKYVSERMLALHLDENIELASRTKAFIDSSLEWIVSRFNIGGTSRICDFGCGPGLYTTRFAERGARVTGIDFSKRSIGFAKDTAKTHNLSINYHLENYLDFETSEKFDLITMIFLDFCALSPAQRTHLLRNFHTFLDDSGELLLDVCSLRQFDMTAEFRGYEYSAANGFWSPEPYYEFQNIYKYDKEKVILYKHTIVEHDRTHEIFNWMQHYSPDTLAAELKESGFGIIETYSDVAGTPFSADTTEFAIVARKS